jgi:hypothetical protein
MRFEVSTEVKIKVVVFWFMTLCSFVGGSHCFGAICHKLEDEGDMFL